MGEGRGRTNPAPEIAVAVQSSSVQLSFNEDVAISCRTIYFNKPRMEVKYFVLLRD
ncbi:hypothetical protein Mal33_01950 [Rosistilla oblonga]|uniref:Uncharacterized protein n=1 Tax=Rosistilla oblonga TaxID=2527990 RepID=A0A518IME9_9BACT|nr:hypothetical protein Mal33_01950 [Rosistilla oblonga]